jgi:hypothetical protein
MNNLIDRYVYDVTRRLPEKDRDEVSKELKSNIYDMLAENADENEIREVLYKLGPPASLAEKYRQNPRYLISPAVYDDYVRVLKWILPLIGILTLCIGMIVGAIDAIKDGMTDAVYFAKNIMSTGISLGISATFQALLWTTIGFVIAERASTKTDEDREPKWNIEDLPEVLPADKGKIPLSDSIAELILTFAFSVLAILLCAGTLPIPFMILDGNTRIYTLFSSSFLTACIPAIIAMFLFGAGESIIKIKERRWTPLVCSAVIINSLISIGVMIYLITRPDIFSAEFTTFLQGFDWSNLDVLRFMGRGGINPIIALVFLIVVICSLAECINAIFKTIRNRNS